MTTVDICLWQWNSYNRQMQKNLDELTDANFSKPIVPGGNSPSWLLGHLAETDDKLLELFGIRNRMYPELVTIYHHDRGSNQVNHLSKEDLLKKWKSIITELDKTFKSMTEADWLSRHTAVSAEDFAKEPHRNKLNVLLSRIAHKASHLGQIAMMHE